MRSISELLLLGRIAMARLALALPTAASRNAKEQFATSVGVAFPHLSEQAKAALYVRHQLSMRKFMLMKEHMSGLSAGQLSDFIERNVQVDGKVQLDTVKQSAAPVIFVAPHYGNFPAGCLKLIKEIGHAKTVNAFYNPPSKNRTSEGFETLLKGLDYGFHALFNDQTAVIKALRVLKRGEALTMMPDVFDISGHALYVPFFGRLVPAMAGTALFALKSRATVIVGYNCPGDGLASTLKLGRPLVFERSGDLEADIAGLTAAIFRELEAQIRHSPEHWFYLQGIGDLLADRLVSSAGDGREWLETLAASTCHFSALLPDWPAILREIKTMQSAGPCPDTMHAIPREA